MITLTAATGEPTSPKLRPAAAFARLAAVSAATGLALAAVGYWPTRAQAGPAGVTAMLVALAICVAGGWAGTLPTLAWLARPAREQPTGIMLGLALRFVLTLGLALAAALAGSLAKAPLLLWVAIGQLVILAVDVAGLAGLLRRVGGEHR